jgi:hypothetical protein
VLDGGSSNGEWSLMDPPKKGKEGKSGRDRVVKREGEEAGNR